MLTSVGHSDTPCFLSKTLLRLTWLICYQHLPKKPYLVFLDTILRVKKNCQPMHDHGSMLPLHPPYIETRTGGCIRIKQGLPHERFTIILFAHKIYQYWYTKYGISNYHNIILKPKCFCIKTWSHEKPFLQQNQHFSLSLSLTLSLSSRSQEVPINDSTSAFSTLSCGVPRGSVLGPLLFTHYTTPLGSVISKKSIKYH